MHPCVRFVSVPSFLEFLLNLSQPLFALVPFLGRFIWECMLNLWYCSRLPSRKLNDQVRRYWEVFILLLPVDDCCWCGREDNRFHAARPFLVDFVILFCRHLRRRRWLPVR